MSADVDERLHLDIFPAEIFGSAVGENARTARVFVTNRRVIAHVLDGEGGTTQLVDEEVRSEIPRATKATLVGELRLSTDAGDIIVGRGQGCGCGSPLRHVLQPVPR